MKRMLQKQGQEVDDEVIDSFVNWSQKKQNTSKANPNDYNDDEPDLPDIKEERKQNAKQNKRSTESY